MVDYSYIVLLVIGSVLGFLYVSSIALDQIAKEMDEKKENRS